MTTTEKPLGFGYQFAAGAIAGVSEVSLAIDLRWQPADKLTTG